jgi:hypothetical protein
VGVHVGALPREDARLWLFWGHHSQFSLMPLVHITFIWSCPCAAFALSISLLVLSFSNVIPRLS